MKLVIDKSDGKWRWSLISVHGMNIKIHSTGDVGEGDARAAFEAGWAEALAKGYVKETVKDAPPSVPQG